MEMKWVVGGRGTRAAPPRKRRGALWGSGIFPRPTTPGGGEAKRQGAAFGFTSADLDEIPSPSPSSDPPLLHERGNHARPNCSQHPLISATEGGIGVVFGTGKQQATDVPDNSISRVTRP